MIGLVLGDVTVGTECSEQLDELLVVVVVGPLTDPDEYRVDIISREIDARLSIQGVDERRSLFCRQLLGYGSDFIEQRFSVFVLQAADSGPNPLKDC